MSVFQRFKNYRNRFIIAIVLRLSKFHCCKMFAEMLAEWFASSLKIQFFAMFTTFQCDFDHNFMRIRSIFDDVDYLNRVHFEFQNELSFIYFTYWMQMLLRCEIDKIAKRMRNHWDFDSSDFDTKILAILSNLTLILRVFHKVFFKKTFEHICDVLNSSRVNVLIAKNVKNRRKQRMRFWWSL